MVRAEVMGILSQGRGHTPPHRDRTPFDLRGSGVQTAAVAFAPEGGDGLRMGEEEPDPPATCEEFVEVVRAGRSGAAVDASAQVGVVEEPEVTVVDHPVLLSRTQGFEGEQELLFDLVHGFVVEVGHPCVYPQHGLGHTRFVVAGRALVVRERALERGFTGVTRGQADVGLPVSVVGAGVGEPVPYVGAQRGRVADGAFGRFPPEGHDDARGAGPEGGLPGPGVLGEDLGAGELPVGQDVEGDGIAVLAPPDPVGLAVREDVHAALVASGLHDGLAGPEFALLEPRGQRLQHRVVVEAPRAGSPCSSTGTTLTSAPVFTHVTRPSPIVQTRRRFTL